MATLDPGVTGRRPRGKALRSRKAKARAPPVPLPAKPAPTEKPLTISVPEAGAKYLGLGKNASYEAAVRGDIPTIRVGKLLRVPVRAMERLLDQATSKLEAAE
jgi:excisionase family DNA binding protein